MANIVWVDVLVCLWRGQSASFPQNGRREAEELQIAVDADDVLVNPDWLTGAARSTGWSRAGLNKVFAADAGVGLHSEEFLARLREAAADQMRGRVTGENTKVAT